MGFRNQNLKQIFLGFLLVLFAFLVILSSSSSSATSSSSDSFGSGNEILPKIKNDLDSNQSAAAAAYQVLRINNTTPFLLNKSADFNKKRSKRKMMKRRKINKKNNFKTRAFSVMLPKGVVPPSGSSPCHNDKHDSTANALTCGLSTTTGKP